MTDPVESLREAVRDARLPPDLLKLAVLQAFHGGAPVEDEGFEEFRETCKALAPLFPGSGAMMRVVQDETTETDALRPG